jgi:hypothetical protein
LPEQELARALFGVQVEFVLPEKIGFEMARHLDLRRNRRRAPAHGRAARGVDGSVRRLKDSRKSGW